MTCTWHIVLAIPGMPKLRRDYGWFEEEQEWQGIGWSVLAGPNRWAVLPASDLDEALLAALEFDPSAEPAEEIPF